jgi:hypothetical protein
MDAVGRTVIKKVYSEFENGTLKVSTADLKTGMYFVAITGTNFTNVKKLVIE